MTDCDVLPLNRAARRLGVPARWLRAEADAGRVPCLRAGAQYLFDIATVSKILADRASQTRQGVRHES